MTETVQSIQVVVAYDFTPSAEEALLRAIEVACRAPQHVLHLVAAIDPRDGLLAVPTRTVDYDYAERVQQMISARVVKVFEDRAAASEVQFYVHARIGKPGDEILGLAEDIAADLVFIGSHGKTGLDRLVLGSVSERVVREARCPVMVVRPKAYEPVELVHVFKYEHNRPTYNPPHRYSYVNRQVLLRPNDWPIS